MAIRSASTSRAAKAKDRLAVLLDQGNHLVLQQGDLLLAIGLLDPDAAQWQMADSVDWMAITIGASCVAATGAIPATARPKEGANMPAITAIAAFSQWSERRFFNVICLRVPVGIQACLA